LESQADGVEGEAEDDAELGERASVGQRRSSAMRAYLVSPGPLQCEARGHYGEACRAKKISIIFRPRGKEATLRTRHDLKREKGNARLDRRVTHRDLKQLR
jgi:hypothetical protein